ncbi:MAG: hypothetical protein ACRDGV_10540 [Candidatus Limnocylindria bacterium]
MTKRIVFLPQNETHAASLRLVVPPLAATGASVRVAQLDGIFHQNLQLTDLSTCAEVRTIDVISEKPFYRMAPWQQIRTLARARSWITEVVEDASDVVAFNDGAVQRLAYARAKRTRARTWLLLDGMISDYRAHGSLGLRNAMRMLGRVTRNNPISLVLPSEVGTAPVDEILTIGEHSAELLRRRNPTSRVSAVGLPRWPTRSSRSRPQSVRRVLYLTGAFRWHAMSALADAQVRDVEAVQAVCRSLGLDLIVRLHPRDEASDYVRIEPHLSVDTATAMSDSILASDLVLSMVSTGLLEAISLGKVARTVAIHAEWSILERSFVAEPAFHALVDRDSLGNELKRLRSRISSADYAEQQAILPYFVAAAGPAATEAIVARLAA